MRLTSSSTTFRGRAVALLALSSASLAVAFDTPYCSNQNTGSGDAFEWAYQSNGKCTDHCNGLGTFAFAVIQWTNCWCSNYIPANQGDTNACKVSCPGFPSENCGDKDKGLYIYLKLAGKPSGTQGGSQPSSTDVSSAVPPPSIAKPASSKAPPQAPASPIVTTRVVTLKPPTVVQTVAGDAQVMTVFSTSVFTAHATEKPQPSSATQATASADQPTSAQPRTSATVLTESGVIVTRTVVFTPSASASATQDGNNNSSSSTGAIVGGVVGGIIGFLAIVGIVLFLLWRKRKQRRDGVDGEGGQSGLNRNTSTMSKNGLLGGHGGEKNTQYGQTGVATSGSQRSRHDNDSIGPLSTSDRRFSQPVVIDSRLNPRAVLTFHGSNESRESLGSIDDSRDYGRQLNVVNPDPSRD